TEARTQITIAVRHTGHRFPTGDPFRRLVVRVCDDEACEHVGGTRVIGKRFDDAHLVADDTLADGETRVLYLPPGRFWTAELYYSGPRFEATLPIAERSIVVARGSLPTSGYTP